MLLEGVDEVGVGSGDRFLVGDQDPPRLIEEVERADKGHLLDAIEDEPTVADWTPGRSWVLKGSESGAPGNGPEVLAPRAWLRSAVMLIGLPLPHEPTAVHDTETVMKRF